MIAVLILCSLVFLTNGEEITDDENSLLASYRLAKQQALESKEATKLVKRGTRSRTADDGDDTGHGCVTYVRWGNSTCPPGANVVYSGAVAGSHYTHTGTAVNPLCLPPNPQYLSYQNNYHHCMEQNIELVKLVQSTKLMFVMYHVLCVRLMDILI